MAYKSWLERCLAGWRLVIVGFLVLIVSTVGVAAPASALTSGTLTAGQSKKVLWGWFFPSASFTYFVSVQDGAGNQLHNVHYDCYASYWPWPIRSGYVTGYMTHTMAPYGDCWLRSPVNATYSIYP